MEIERIEDWIGQALVDADGEKIGKVEDFFFAGESRAAALVAVKTGVLGRGKTLAPLTGAKAGRDYLRVAVAAARVKDAPESDAADQVDDAEAAALASHYDVEIDSSGGLESARARSRREAEARAAAERAEELEALAERKGEEADRGEQAAKERDEALREAERERRKAESG